jgi:HAD superfamily hydrolase (TIGR01509 family)
MKNSKPFGVLWDMDGTIVDTVELHFQSWYSILSARGIPITRESLRSLFGKNARGVIAGLQDHTPEAGFMEELIEHKERNFREAVREKGVPLFPGAVEWLQTLHGRGVRQAIASSAPMGNITAIVEKLDLGRYFEALVPGADLPPKPAPDVFLEAARQLDLPPERCIVIEDSVFGVQAAQSAGMRCIAVTTTHAADELPGPDVLVARLSDLPEDVFERLSGSAL